MSTSLDALAVREACVYLGASGRTTEPRGGGGASRWKVGDARDRDSEVGGGHSQLRQKRSILSAVWTRGGRHCAALSVRLCEVWARATRIDVLVLGLERPKVRRARRPSRALRSRPRAPCFAGGHRWNACRAHRLAEREAVGRRWLACRVTGRDAAQRVSCSLHAARRVVATIDAVGFPGSLCPDASPTAGTAGILAGRPDILRGAFAGLRGPGRVEVIFISLRDSL